MENLASDVTDQLTELQSDAESAGDTPRTVVVQKSLAQSMAEGDKSVVPMVDEGVLKELEEAETEAKNTANIITGLKDRVAVLLTVRKLLVNIIIIRQTDRQTDR